MRIGIAIGHILIKGFTTRANSDSSFAKELILARFDLTDFEWSVIQPQLPNKPRGVVRVDDGRVLNGIFWRLRTGAPWADIPAWYGPCITCVNRFGQWASYFGGLRRGRRQRPRLSSTCLASYLAIL
jgi:hypothetical protein